MKEKIINVELQDFLKDFEKESNTQILEEGKEKDELFAIAKARGYKLKGSKDLAGFKTIYTFANKANKNKARLPKEKLLKALPTLIGKPVDVDHIRSKVIGHYIDYRYRQKEDMVIAYGVFYKNNFGELWKEAKKLFKSKKLSTSYEIWCPKDKRKKLADGTFELQEMEIAGGALLFKEEPAFEDAKVLELAKKNLEKESSDLVYAKKYKEEEIITSNYFFDEVKKNVKKLSKERNDKKIEEEKKKIVELTKKPTIVDVNLKEKPKEEVKKDDKVEEKKEQQLEKPEKIEPIVSKIKCSNCEEEINLIVTPEHSQGIVKCHKCFAMINGQTGKMIYPPQIKDFKVNCPSCNVSNWLILSNNEKETKLRCESCSKEYKVDFVHSNIDIDNLLDKFSFVYNGNVRCHQCNNTIKISGISNLKNRTIKCPECNLEFSFNITHEKYRKVSKIDEIIKIEKPLKTEKGGNEMDKDKVEKIPNKKVEQKAEELKVEEPKAEVKETPKVEEKKEKASLKDTKEDNVQATMNKLFQAPKGLDSGKTWVDDVIKENKEELPKEVVVSDKPKIEKVIKTTVAKKTEPEKIEKKEAKKVEINKEFEDLKIEIKNKALEISSLKEKTIKYAKGIKKLAFKIRSTNKELKIVKAEKEEKIKFYKENAKKIYNRRKELGDFSKDFSDNDILNEDKFEKAQLKKQLSESKTIETASENVGDKIIRQEYYSDIRKKVNKAAYGEK